MSVVRVFGPYEFLGLTISKKAIDSLDHSGHARRLTIGFDIQKQTMGSPPNELDRWLRTDGPGLVLYARQWIDCQADAEDVFHDAFVRFWRNRANVRNPQAYLYQCVRNCALDRIRSDSRRERREVEKKWALLAGPQQDAESNERREQIEAALSRLSIEQREVVVLKHWSNLTFEAISQVLEISPRTAQSRHRYALTKLREELAQYDSHERSI